MIWLAGWLGVAAEQKLPRLIVPGVMGTAAIVGGGSYLVSHAQRPATAALYLALSAVLFVVEATWRMHFAAGVAGTVVLGYAFCHVLARPHGMEIVLAMAGSVLPGVLLSLTAARTREARRAKRSYG